MIIKILFKWSVFNTVVFFRVAFLRAFVVKFIRAFLRSGCPSQDTLTLPGKWPARRNWATPWLGNTQMCWDNGRFEPGWAQSKNGQSNNPIELIPHHSTILQSSSISHNDHKKRPSGLFHFYEQPPGRHDKKHPQQRLLNDQDPATVTVCQ
jgi:hypothetical protein